MMNNLTLVQVVDEMQLMGAPSDVAGTVAVNLNLVSQWRRSDLRVAEGEYPLRITLLAPDGSQLLQSGLAPINLTHHAQVRSLTGMMALPVKGIGTHEFLIEIQVGGEWHVEDRVPLVVANTLPSTPPPAPVA